MHVGGGCTPQAPSHPRQRGQLGQVARHQVLCQVASMERSSLYFWTGRQLFSRESEAMVVWVAVATVLLELLLSSLPPVARSSSGTQSAPSTEERKVIPQSHRIR